MAVKVKIIIKDSLAITYLFRFISFSLFLFLGFPLKEKKNLTNRPTDCLSREREKKSDGKRNILWRGPYTHEESKLESNLKRRNLETYLEQR